MCSNESTAYRQVRAHEQHFSSHPSNCQVASIECTRLYTRQTKRQKQQQQKSEKKTQSQIYTHTQHTNTKNHWFIPISTYAEFNTNSYGQYIWELIVAWLNQPCRVSYVYLLWFSFHDPSHCLTCTIYLYRFCCCCCCMQKSMQNHRFRLCLLLNHISKAMAIH